MINKISSQVVSDKKSYFKEYDTAYGHVLNMTRKANAKQNKENSQVGENKNS